MIVALERARSSSVRVSVPFTSIASPGGKGSPIPLIVRLVKPFNPQSGEPCQGATTSTFARRGPVLRPTRFMSRYPEAGAFGVGQVSAVLAFTVMPPPFIAISPLLSRTACGAVMTETILAPAPSPYAVRFQRSSEARVTSAFWTAIIRGGRRVGDYRVSVAFGRSPYCSCLGYPRRNLLRGVPLDGRGRDDH
jgi:hypothetical protein